MKQCLSRGLPALAAVKVSNVIPERIHRSCYERSSSVGKELGGGGSLTVAQSQCNEPLALFYMIAAI